MFRLLILTGPLAAPPEPVDGATGATGAGSGVATGISVAVGIGSAVGGIAVGIGVVVGGIGGVAVPYCHSCVARHARVAVLLFMYASRVAVVLFAYASAFAVPVNIWYRRVEVALNAASVAV